jgi:hypothetical protein
MDKIEKILKDILGGVSPNIMVACFILNLG